MQQLEFSLESFENSAKESNGRYWNAHEFMHNLGYETWTSFNGTINRAMASCAQLGVEISEAFISETIIDQGASVKSYRLSRFACFLITMHADSKKPRVQQAKVALAAVADALVEQHIQSSSLARIDAREDLKHAEKVMTSIASEQGLESENIGFFKDAGFRGMYNMSLTQLKSYKNIESKSTLYDFMGLTELAGNLFRATQTAERIKNENVRGTRDLVETAKDVGWEVRKMMLKNSGVKPEDLSIEQDISKVKKTIKSAAKEMGKLDSPQKKISKH